METITAQNAVTFGFEKVIYAVFLHYFDLGKIAVIVFFAISGFVVPFALLKPQKNPIKNFIISRVCRLYPAYWVSMIFAVPFFYVLPGNAISAKTIFFNALMLQQFVGIENIMEIYWTLQIELIFYACCVALFCMGWLRDNRMIFYAAMTNVALALILALTRYFMHRKLPVALPMSLSIMFWGMLWRAAIDDQKSAAAAYAWRWLQVYVACVPIISMLAYNDDMGFGETWYKYTLTYISAVLLFIYFTKYHRIESDGLAYIGIISYSVYLFGPIAEDLTLRAAPHLQFKCTALYLIIAAGVATAWAAPMYRMVELKAIRYGRELITRREMQAERPT